jgi:hypothetical protein
MKAPLPLDSWIFEGSTDQVRKDVRELLAERRHAVAILNEVILPEIEASGRALRFGSVQLSELPELGVKLQAVMGELAASLRRTGLALHFKVGRAGDDVFDLWGTEIAGAFEAAGFLTSRSSEKNRCEVITVCTRVNDARRAPVSCGGGLGIQSGLAPGFSW